MIKLAISGCHGRMGRRITELALADKDLEVSALIEHPQHPRVKEKIQDRAVRTEPESIRGGDVLIEFTSSEATMAHLDFCRKNHVRMVIGTTGLTPEHNDAIRKAAQEIAIVYSANMSVGVNIFFRLTQLLAQRTPAQYRVHIREAHHVHKKDAPSGTAKTLARIIEDHSPHKVEKIDAVREGEIIGDHTIVFESEEDTITIEHHAKTRDIFARGALVAAKFLQDKASGLYTMQDVLGIE